MITKIKITDEETLQDMKNMAKYYAKVYNSYYDYSKNKIDSKKLAIRIANKYDMLADKRMYNAISNHLLERREELTTFKPSIFRLKNVFLINGSFLLNGVLLQFPIDYDGIYIVGTIRIKIIKDEIIAQFDIEDMRQTNTRRNTKHYIHYWDYIDIPWRPSKKGYFQC